MSNSLVRVIRRLCAVSACVAALGPAAHAASEAAYPQRQIRIIVPFSPGGGIDVLARTLGQKLAEQWSVPIVVENKPGASGNIGTDLAAKSSPDGYSYLMTANTIVMTPSLLKGVPFDPVNDFVPIAPLAIGSLALVARPDLPVDDVQGLIAHAKAQAGRLNYGSPGNGTPHHLAMELLKQRAEFDALHVPYKGSGGLIVDVMSGQVDIAFAPVHQVLAHVRAGNMKMLAAGGAQRTPVTPQVPSLEEAAAIGDIDVDMWYGLYLPAGTPEPIVSRINQDINAVLRLPEVRETLSQQGLQPSGGTPAQLGELTRNDLARWGQVIDKAGLRAD